MISCGSKIAKEGFEQIKLELHFFALNKFYYSYITIIFCPLSNKRRERKVCKRLN